MASLEAQLHAAALEGDLDRLQACLAAGAIPSALVPRHVRGRHESALHAAAKRGHAACVQQLLRAGTDPNIATDDSVTPLHQASIHRHLPCVEALLAAGAAAEACGWGRVPPLYIAAAKGDAPSVQALLAAGVSPCPVLPSGWPPAHVGYRRAAVLRLLLAAQPEAAAHRTSDGRTPLAIALSKQRFDSAHCLLTEGSVLPVDEVLALLGQQGPEAQPLFAALPARQQMTAAEWAHVPAPCAGLAAVLPAVLGRSVEKAALLVRHLPPADSERLRAAALCLARAQQVHGVHLPTPLVWRLLANSAAD
ncbi:hypothetical protein ABPG75_009268 [Micractinium tetrahymenae]